MEIGLSFGLAQQMVNTMNKTMNTMQVAGVNAGTTGGVPVAEVTGSGSGAADQWYAAIDGHLAGPLSERDMRQLIERDILVDDTLLWRPGMTAWTQAVDIPEVNKELLLK